MSQLVGSASWGREDHDSTSGAGSLRSSRLRARRFPPGSNRSFYEARSSHPEYPSSSGEPLNSGPKIRRLRAPSKAVLKPRAAADAQTSLTLDPSVVVSGFKNNGQVEGSTNTPSLTSSNNFINFCSGTSVPISDGKQITTGSCNPAPMGLLPSNDHLPSVLITQPAKGSTVQANTTFALKLSVGNLQSGVFTSPTTNFQAAPQQLDSTGNIIGHYHVMIEELDALNSVVPMDSTKFAYFSVISDVASNGTIVTSITNGLPEGFYRATVSPRAANHQPVIASVIQRGALNDVAYFTVTADGKPGSTPAAKRRAPRHVYTPPSEAKRAVVPRADAAESSLTLASSVIAHGFESSGGTTSGQSASLTSSNNFINFCATTTLPLTNGTQVLTGSCNSAPMGLIPAVNRMPTSKFTYPRNGDILATNAPMTVGLAITNFASGNFANVQTNYLAAPQQLDSNGQIQGHAMVVIEEVAADPLTALDPRKFLFFKGLTGVADSTGVLTTEVADGFPAGFYRLSSIIATTNGNPALLPTLQHGAVDDAIYFVVVDGGPLPTNQTALPNSVPSTSKTSSASGTAQTNIPSQSSASVAPVGKTHVGAAVGGALAGIVILVLGLVGIWLFIRRRRRNAQASQLAGHPAVLNSEDFGAPLPTPFTSETAGTSSMSQVRSPPSSYAPKMGREASTRSARRSSTASAAPSYHTVVG